jgi:hypothetical protein
LKRIFKLVLNIFDVVYDWVINKYDYLSFEYMDYHLNMSGIISEIPETDWKIDISKKVQQVYMQV